MDRVLEEGRVCFFYRLRVGQHEVQGLQDVQRFFLVLVARDRRLFRRLIVGRKRLPDPRRHERFWALVAEVAEDPAALQGELGVRFYETRTRGVRVDPPALSVGEGRYALMRHERHTHLAYVLTSPPEPGPMQDMFLIRREASYVAAVRNPSADAPRGTGLPARAHPELPPELMNRFAGRRFAMIDDPAFLDHAGVEIVLIGASEDVRAELGITLDADGERRHDEGIYEQLRLPDQTGTWR
jgi:hypothetical protein